MGSNKNQTHFIHLSNGNYIEINKKNAGLEFDISNDLPPVFNERRMAAHWITARDVRQPLKNV